MYCCDLFESGCKNKDRAYPNIRIVKFTSSFLLSKNNGIFITQNGEETKFIKGSRNTYRYFIGNTVGAFKFGSPLYIMINFCPYCGQNLYEFYNNDKYATEMEGKTFTL